jgi:hypothetical protein
MSAATTLGSTAARMAERVSALAACQKKHRGSSEGNQLRVLSTTTDGARSHGKYVVDNVIVYRDVYRGQESAFYFACVLRLTKLAPSHSYG